MPKAERKRKFQFGNKETGFQIAIKESFSGYGLHLWPSGILLSEYLWHNPNLILNQTILELGAGVALPSLLCSNLGAKSVIITDSITQTEVLENIKSNILLNNEKKSKNYHNIRIDMGSFFKRNY